MNFPANAKFTEEHEWIIVDGDVATIGITDFAQQQLGEIVFVESETIGENLSKGDVFGTIEAVKTVSDLFMPVSGEVLEMNSKLEKEPELVNKEPYGEGWIIKVKMSDTNELNDLLDAAVYQTHITHK